MDPITIKIIHFIWELVIHKMVYRLVDRRRQKFEPLIRQKLETARGVLTLPELVKRIGLKDSFYNRGTVLAMVSRGEVIETDNPNTTITNRLNLRKYRLTTRTYKNDNKN
ncbi:hypothetical protein [Leptospira kirschneri]|uniref:hypothetical protein n=1 Tax=Leptospira kirschneri TaxID=29507 RepID=UPI00037D12B4|nr:hypothetical protein [Leptospira kirschneri]KON76624.1 Uncharacterized protein NV38_0002696 [Leptospira kirschneri serovar Mozdok]KPZ76789.1 hypothetical protein APS47_13780 [Leptospira kirschneri serovar Mozdok]NDK06704.1 hypothetical protein [Leptospira kirschneri serovar Mozdok]OOV47604.1 hypothetical protein B1J94_15330 [Leptospira kirschneri serovar Grippotyphosa]UZW35193.1 hypothetical protein ORQ95_10875 [Leptospira kirschneri]